MRPTTPARPRTLAVLRRLSWSKGVRRVAAGVAAAALVGGCTPLKEYVHNGFKVGPNYKTPPAPVAADWIDAADVRVRKDTDDLSKWWTVFNDPILNALVCDAYRQNLSLKEAGFRILQARAELGIAKGELFPQQQGAGGGFQQRAVSLEVANREATPQRFFPQWQYGFGLSWELDFWGRFRRQIEAAADRLDGSVANYDDVLVTLLGDVASNYVQLRVAQQQLAYLQQNVKLQRETLGLAKAQFQGGQVSELDPDQAQSTLTATEAQVPQTEIAIRQAANRLCLLLGIPMEDLEKRLGPGPIPVAPPAVGVGMPADLLARRPDVRRQERAAAAAAAEIGVADANFYPAISILGQVGYAAQFYPDLFNSQAFTGSVGPSFQWNILNYGRILNGVRQKEAQFNEAVARYQNTVLKANEEVENGLVTFLKAHQQTRSQADSVAAAQKSVAIAMAQYNGGTIDFNRVSLIQQNLVQRQIELATAQGQIALGLIQVYRALGGGWELRETGCDGPGLPPCNKTSTPAVVNPAAPPTEAPPDQPPVPKAAPRVPPPVPTLPAVPMTPPSGVRPGEPLPTPTPVPVPGVPKGGEPSAGVPGWFPLEVVGGASQSVQPASVRQAPAGDAAGRPQPNGGAAVPNTAPGVELRWWRPW